MVETKTTKDLNLALHIKSVNIKVTEQTPVYVIWSRGNIISYSNNYHTNLIEFVHLMIISLIRLEESKNKGQVAK